MNSIDSIQLALCQALFDASWSGVLLALLAYGIFRLSPAQSAATRHNLGMLILSAMLIFPLLRFFQVWSFVDGSSAAAVTAKTPALSLITDFSAAQLCHGNRPELPAYLACFWGLGVSLMLLRLTASYVLLQRWQQQFAASLCAEWQQRLQQLSLAMAIKRAVSLRLIKQSLEPWSAYLFKPVVVLPQRLLQEFSESQIKAILAHELAHIKRYDWLWNGWQCLIEALLFFHPAVWYLSRQIRAEREHACDDLAIQVGVDPLNLATALTQLAQLRRQEQQTVPSLSLASFAHGQNTRISQFGLRIRRLLEPRSQQSISWKIVIPALFIAISLFATPLFMRQSHALTASQEQAKSSAATDGVPTPPLPELPPLPDSPPEAPLPPPAPSLEKMEVFKDINAILKQDPRVLQKLGQPIQVRQHGVGRVYIKEWWFEPGQTEAKLSVSIEGPQGKANLQVHAVRPDKTWQFKVLSLEFPGEAASMNLLKQKT